jgi:hypothetical protein
MLRILSPVMLIAASAACGTPAQCTATLSGAANGTYDCGRPGLGWVSTADQFNFSIKAPPVDSDEAFSNPPAIDLVVKFSGEPRPGTYTEATVGGEGSIHAEPQWAAVFGDGSAIGTVELTFKSVAAQPVAGGGKAYTAAGALDAVLPSQSGSAGPVNLHVAFSWP